MEMKNSILLYLTITLLQIWHAQGLICKNPDQPSGIITFSRPRYSPTSECWYILPPEDSYVRLNFQNLELNDPYCESAYIEVYEENAEQKHKICQDNRSWSKYKSQNWTRVVLGAVNITIHLRNHYDSVNFELQYNIENIVCMQKNHFRCSANHCIHSNQVCDGIEDCEDESDEAECGPLAITAIREIRINSINWLKGRQANYGWGKNTHRAITALYLTGAAKFRGNNIQEEMMVKQLELKTMASLLRNSTYHLSVNELSMYVNALTVTCHNNRNFYGKDLLQILGSRADSSSPPSPGAYLTLCNSKWPISTDKVSQLLNLLSENTKYPSHIEVQAMTIMALSCIKEKTNFFHTMYNAPVIYNETVENFMVNQKSDGSFGNAHTTAMVTQALISSGQFENRLWNAEKAMKFLIKNLNSSSVDFLSVYLCLPIFKVKSLTDIGSVDCSGYHRKLAEDDEILDIMDKLGGKVHVQYSLYIGHHKEIIHTLYLRIPENSTVFDVMKVAQVADSKYKFSYNKVDDHIYVYELGGMTNDMEAGKFWFFYKTSSESNFGKIHLKQFTESPDEIMIKNKEHLVMWYKSAHA